jgi:plasmid stability protein
MRQIGAEMEPLVPVNLSIKNAPDDVVQRLRERAARNHRSLQGELMAIIDDAVRLQPARYLTVHEALAKVRELNLQQPDEAAALVRADRDSGHAEHRDQGR